MNGPADDAAFQERLLDTAWLDARQSWTDAGAREFDQQILRPIRDTNLAYTEAMQQLQELLYAAEQATEY